VQTAPIGAVFFCTWQGQEPQEITQPQAAWGKLPKGSLAQSPQGFVGE